MMRLTQIFSENNEYCIQNTNDFHYLLSIPLLLLPGVLFVMMNEWVECFFMTQP